MRSQIFRSRPHVRDERPPTSLVERPERQVAVDRRAVLAPYKQEVAGSRPVPPISKRLLDVAAS